jgi:ABC-type glycerol-3-phosphate transport system substrate-binding protein
MDGTGEMLHSHPRSVGLLLIPLLLEACLSGCAGANATPDVPAATAIPSSVPFIPTSTPALGTSQDLMLWVSEEFTPDSDSPAAQRFAARLAEFQEKHPGLTIDVRVKAPTGIGGLAAGLLAADAAAPNALPDLALLDPAGLEVAATHGLLVPLEGVLAPPTAPEWTEAASEASRVNGVFYGLPLATDAVGLAYRKDVYAAPPGKWANLLRGPAPFVFPAADPTALFLLSQYQGLGGALIDDSRRPALDPTLLTLVLAFEDSMHAAGRLPLSTGQMTSTSEGWAAILDGRAVSGPASFRDYALQADTESLGFIPLPSREGPGDSYASTWCWALLPQSAGGQTLAVELLLWLTDAEFSGPLARELALLPAAHSGLDLWPQDPLKDTAAGLMGALRAVPSVALQDALGPRVRDAALDVLTGKSDAMTAAQAAAAPIPPPP